MRFRELNLSVPVLQVSQDSWESEIECRIVVSWLRKPLVHSLSTND